MNLNAALPEQMNIAAGFVPIDMGAGANTGDWVSLANYAKLCIVLFKAVGTAGQDPTLTVLQATDNAGAGSKALTFTNIWTKQDTLLSSVGTWTMVEQAAANTYTDATSAEDQAIWAVDINADQLDLANGFDHVSCSVADIGAAAQVGCAFYLLYGPRYGGDAMPSAL